MPDTQSTRWCFTINNPTSEDEVRLKDLGSNPMRTKYLVFGREVGETGTPHLQGFIILAARRRFGSVKRIIGETAHIETANGTSAQAADYCKKDGDYEEIGTPPVKGKTNRFDEFKTWVLDQPTKPSKALIAQEYPSIFLQYGRVIEWVDLIYPQPKLIGDDFVLRSHQGQLLDRLLDEPDDRSVEFIIDHQGASGKSWFVNLMLEKYPDICQSLSVGKRDDIAFIIDESKSIFFFDIPRSQSEYFQYSVLEQIKDKRVFSTKYQGKTKHLSKNAHVVCFMNEEPDMNKLTADRYKITHWMAEQPVQHNIIN